MYPRILKNFNVFVNGRGYAGVVDEVELPELSVKTEEHRAGGMDGVFEVDMGMEAMTAKFTFADPAAEIIALAANQNSSSARIQVRGSWVRDSDMTRVPMLVEIGGAFKKLTLGTWKAGDKAKLEYEARVNYFRVAIAGEDVIEIDVENMIRMIGGVDQLAGIRADIGM